MTENLAESLRHPRDPKAALKRKLCAAIDDLSDADGFVLVATADDITFAHLKAAGWDEHVLELEPLKAAEARRDYEYWRRIASEMERSNAALERETAAKEARLADVNAALANVLGEKR